MKLVAIGVVLAGVLSGPASAQDVLMLRGPGSQIGVTIREGADGVVIDQVRDGAPAQRAGFKPGDVVAEFAGEPIRSARQMTRVVQETRPDRPVTAIVMRDGARHTLTVTPETSRADADRVAGIAADIARRSREFSFRVDPPDIDLLVPPRRLGAQLMPLSDQLAGYFGVKGGVLVSSVEDGSPAALAGLKPGDVITSVGGQTVETPADLSRRVRSAEPGSTIELTVTRDKKEQRLKATIPDMRSRRLLPGRNSL